MKIPLTLSERMPKMLREFENIKSMNSFDESDIAYTLIRISSIFYASAVACMETVPAHLSFEAKIVGVIMYALLGTAIVPVTSSIVAALTPESVKTKWFDFLNTSILSTHKQAYEELETVARKAVNLLEVEAEKPQPEADIEVTLQV